MNTCFFIGHRNAPESLRGRLATEVERHIVQWNVSHFIVGGYGSFDRMAASIVKAAKVKYPHITLQLLLPYHPAERPVPTLEGFDGTLYPFEKHVPHRLAIVKANRAMVDSCGYLIAYAVHPGNTRNLLEYAQRPCASIHITNLADTPNAERQA